MTTPKVETEQTLKVKMPQGSTERSKKLIAKQKQAAATAAGTLEHLSTTLLALMFVLLFYSSQND